MLASELFEELAEWLQNWDGEGKNPNDFNVIFQHLPSGHIHEGISMEIGNMEFYTPDNALYLYSQKGEENE